MAFKVRKDEVRGTKSRTLRSLDQLDATLIGGASTTFAASLQHQVPGSVITNTGTPNSFAASTKGYAPLIAASTTVFDPSSAHQMSPTLIGPGTSAFEANLALALKPDLIDQTGTTNAPLVSEAGDTSYPLIPNLGVTRDPVINLALALDAIGSGTTVSEPSLSSTVSPTTVDSTGILFGPRLDQALAPDSIASGSSLFDPAFSVTTTFDGIPPATAIYGPYVAGLLSMAAITQSASVFTPGAKQRVSPERLGSTSIFAPAFSTVFKPGVITRTPSLFSPKFGRRAFPDLIQQLGATKTPAFAWGVRPDKLGGTVVYATERVFEQFTYTWETITNTTVMLVPHAYRVFPGEVETTVRLAYLASAVVRAPRATSIVRFAVPQDDFD